MNVIITGAASGIGRAAAIRLAKRMHVVLADRNMVGAQALAEELRAAGHGASAIEVDVASRASVRAMVERARAEVGPIDALFSNAGIIRRNPVDQIAESDWDLMMATHVKGTFLCCQAVLGEMVERGRGLIVNTSSDYAIMGVAGNAAYTSAKTAIYSLTKSLAAEFTPQGIRVNAIGPGPIDTPLLQSGRSEAEYAAMRDKFTKGCAARPHGPAGRRGLRRGFPDERTLVLHFGADYSSQRRAVDVVRR